jgi:hypothetical protein
VTVSVGCKEPSAVTPEEGPNLFTIGLRQIQRGQFSTTVESKISFPMRGWNALQARPDFEEKHQPVSLSLIPIFADKTTQVQVGRREGNARLFQSLTARAGVR